MLPLHIRQYTEEPLMILRQYAEIYDRQCGKIRKITTAYAAVCGKLQPQMWQYEEYHCDTRIEAVIGRVLKTHTH